MYFASDALPPKHHLPCTISYKLCTVMHLAINIRKSHGIIHSIVNLSPQIVGTSMKSFPINNLFYEGFKFPLESIQLMM